MIALVSAVMTARAEVTFTYEAGAELQSTYLWRGNYCGGLSLQPSLSAGYEGEHTWFTFNAWGNIGASDWFYNKETTFIPEIDLTATFGTHGFQVGFTHYYYCDGSNFFSWKNINKVVEEDATSNTEVFAGYDFSEIHEKAGAYINWYTMVAGRDERMDEDSTLHRAYSSYLELGYKYTFDRVGLTLDGTLAFSPWTSDYVYGNTGFAVQCVSLRLEKEWAWDACSLTLFAQGMIKPSAMQKGNIFVKAGDAEWAKTDQTLNGTIGLGIWF